jgi:hypothetical protein
MTIVQAKMDSGEHANLRVEIDNSDVVLSVERQELASEDFRVRLEAAQLDELISTLRDLRRKLRQEQRGKGRPKDVAADQHA